MLVSNQRPLPCEGSTMVCCSFLELAECLQIAVFVSCRFSQHFRRFARVAAQLLHTLEHKRDGIANYLNGRRRSELYRPSVVMGRYPRRSL